MIPPYAAILQMGGAFLPRLVAGLMTLIRTECDRANYGPQVWIPTVFPARDFGIFG